LDAVPDGGDHRGTTRTIDIALSIVVIKIYSFGARYDWELTIPVAMNGVHVWFCHITLLN
jgi:hypothetical protein